MAFENRRGRKYFYRKIRIGDRVFSEYIGNRAIAGVIEAQGKLERWERVKERLNLEDLREKDKKIDKKINELAKFNRNLVEALFLTNGFRKHKGQWRKKRL